MHGDPFQEFERWLTADSFAVRREVLLAKAERSTRPPSNQHLKKLGFQGAHVWPLNWGGPEVKRVFYAHGPTVNGSIQKRVENSVGRLTRQANRNAVRIFVTAEAWRYKELNLLERVTYRIQAVTPDFRLWELGEVTVFQRLSQRDRTSLVRGQNIAVSPNRLVAVDGNLRSSVNSLSGIIEGLRTTRLRKVRPSVQALAGASAISPSEFAAEATLAEQRGRGTTAELRSVDRATTARQRGTGGAVRPEAVERTTTSNQRGTGVGSATVRAVGGVAVGIAQGLLAQAALSKDVAARRTATGYAAKAEDYNADESRVVKLYRHLSGAEGQAELADRFDIHLFRTYLRKQAARARPGEELAVRMPIRTREERRDPIYGHPSAVFREVRVYYRKYAAHPNNPQHGEWLDERVADWPDNATIEYIPDLDRIIDPSRTDAEILEYLGLLNLV